MNGTDDVDAWPEWAELGKAIRRINGKAEHAEDLIEATEEKLREVGANAIEAWYRIPTSVGLGWKKIGDSWRIVVMAEDHSRDVKPLRDASRETRIACTPYLRHLVQAVIAKAEQLAKTDFTKADDPLARR